MIKVLVHGACGKMGGHVIEALKRCDDMELFCGVDIMAKGGESFTCYSSFDAVEGKPDVIIDFSFHTLVKSVLDYAVKENVPVIIATTALDDEEKNAVSTAANKIPVFLAYNMSFGIALLCDFAKKAAENSAMIIKEYIKR